MIYYIKPWIYPIILSVEMVTAVIITYLKSTHDGDAEKDFPYISDTGNEGISASAFSLLMNFYGFLVFVNVTIRFEQIKKNYSYKENRIRFIANIVMLLAGLASCLGVTLAASFQLGTLELVHNIGAVMAFGIGAGYCGMQSLFSFFIRDIPGSNIIINIIRLVISILQAAFVIGTLAVTIKYRRSKDLDYKREAAILEWIAGFLITIYFLTFIKEFSKYDWTIQLERSKMKINQVTTSDPRYQTDSDRENQRSRVDEEINHNQTNNENQSINTEKENHRKQLDNNTCFQIENNQIGNGSIEQ